MKKRTRKPAKKPRATKASGLYTVYLKFPFGVAQMIREYGTFEALIYSHDSRALPLAKYQLSDPATHAVVSREAVDRVRAAAKTLRGDKSVGAGMLLALRDLGLTEGARP